MDNVPIDNAPSYEQLSGDCCAMSLQLEAIRKIVEGQIPSYNSANDETVRRIVESAIDKVCGGADPIDTIRGLFPHLYVARHRT